MLQKISTIFFLSFLLIKNIMEGNSAESGESNCILKDAEKWRTISGIEMLKEKEPFGKGGLSKVFRAIPLNWGNLENKKLEGKCVALKLTPEDGVDEFENELEILKEFSNEKRVVKYFGSGKSASMGTNSLRLGTILELGEHNLGEEMEREFEKWRKIEKETGKKSKIGKEKFIQKIFREIAEILMEVHRKAMHLDLKPENLIYVAENEGNKILKIIDFGSGLRIPEKDGQSAEGYLGFGSEEGENGGKSEENREKNKRANYRWKTSNAQIRTTLAYSAPEMNKFAHYYANEYKEAEVSTKADIWALGMIGFYAFLIEKQFEKKDQIDDQSAKEINKLLEKIGYLFVENNALKWRMRFMAENKYNLEHIKLIILASEFHPQLFQLISVTLHRDPKMRPTAKGILDFLDEKCQLELAKDEENYEPAILPSMGRTRILAILREKIAILEGLKGEEDGQIKEKIGELRNLVKILEENPEPENLKRIELKKKIDSKIEEIDKKLAKLGIFRRIIYFRERRRLHKEKEKFEKFGRELAHKNVQKVERELAKMLEEEMMPKCDTETNR